MKNTETTMSALKTLSEYDSKRIIEEAGVLISQEIHAVDETEALDAAHKIGYPVALKGSGSAAAHKTELGLVRLNLRNDNELKEAFAEIMKKGLDLDGVLIQEMVEGDRQFVIGLTRDPQFGPCVMFGIGGIFTEAMKDTSFRVAPITEDDAAEMLDEIKMKTLLDEFRGAPAVDREALCRAIAGISRLGIERPDIQEIDINPLIITGTRPVAVDALVVMA